MAVTNRIYIDGDSSQWIDVDPHDAQAGFQEAVEALLPTGGTLSVTPGEDPNNPGTPLPYRFNDRVVVRYPDTEIVLSKGATLEPSPTAPGLFAVTVTDFHLQGGAIRDSGAAVDRNLIRFADTGSRADRGAITATRFEIQVPADRTGYHIVHATGQTSNDPLRGLTVRGCSFLLGGAQSSTAESGGLPTGAVCVRTRDCSHTAIQGNRFLPLDRAVGYTGGLVVMENDPFSLISDNTAEALTLQAVDGTANPLMRLSTYSNNEGHHSHITNNFVEGIRCSSVFRLEAGAFDAIVGNSVGRSLCLDAAVHCTAVDGRLTSSVRIGGGNDFHNITGGHYILLSGSEDVLIGENSFTLISQGQVVIEITGGSSAIRVATEVMQFAGKSGVTSWTPIQGGPPVPA